MVHFAGLILAKCIVHHQVQPSHRGVWGNVPYPMCLTRTPRLPVVGSSGSERLTSLSRL